MKSDEISNTCHRNASDMSVFQQGLSSIEARKTSTLHENARNSATKLLIKSCLNAEIKRNQIKKSTNC